MIGSTRIFQGSSIGGAPNTRKRSDAIHGAAFLVAGALCVCSQIAFAVEEIPEIVVTAQKRGEQNIQDVAIAIQAISDRTLAKAGATDVTDFAKLAPSVNIVDMSSGQYQINIRGITAGASTVASTQDKPLASIYFDDMPVTFTSLQPNLELFDVERIEVLRGPQGTLYGAGSMGGNIRFIFHKPTFDRVSGVAEVKGANTKGGDGSYSIKGAVNVPLSETFAARVSGTYQDDGGYIDKPLSNERNTNDLSRRSLRLATLWNPNSKFRLSTNVFWQDQRAADRKTTNVPGTPTLWGNVSTNGDFNYHRLFKEPMKDRQFLGNVTAEYDFDGVSLVSSTSYLNRELHSLREQIFSEFLSSVVAGVPIVPGQAFDNWYINSFVQELRLSSHNQGPLNWLVGAFYSNERLGYDENYPAPGFEQATGFVTTGYGAPLDNLFTGYTSNSQDQFALFGELTYSFSKKWEAVLGVRGFAWKQDFYQGYGGFLNGGPTVNTGTSRIKRVSPKFSLSYRVSDDAMVYALASKGYRLGGLNDPVPPEQCAAQLAYLGLAEAPNSFGPDGLWNYEAGAKTSWLQHRLTVNATAFYLKWTDIQTRRSLNQPNPCGFSFTDNVGKARSEGIELEVTAHPTDGLSVTLGGTYTDAQLTADATGTQFVKGTRLPYSPKLKLSAAIDYTHAISASLKGYTRLDFEHVGERYTSLELDNRIAMPSYDLGNFLLGVTTEKGNWDLEAYVRNLWDERAIYVASAGGLGSGADQLLERPRTIGLALRKRF